MALQGTLTPPASVMQWAPLANQYGTQYGVAPSLILGVIWQESNGVPNAVSSAGARGLMQLMPGTASGLGVIDSFDPAQNIAGGTRYLAELLQSTGGNVAQALGHYYGCFGCLLPSGNTYPNEVMAKIAAIGPIVAGLEQSIVNFAQNVLQTLQHFYSVRPSQGYGPTDLALEPAYNGVAHFHMGVDLPQPTGTLLPSLASGTVVASYNGCAVNAYGCSDPNSTQFHGYGNYLVIKLANGAEVMYGHLLKAIPPIGAHVSVGDIVGLTDNNGYSTGPHLHLMMMNPDGTQLDPTPFIQAAATSDRSLLSQLYQGTIGNTAQSIGQVASGVGDQVKNIGNAITNMDQLAQQLGHAISWLNNPASRPIMLFAGFGVVFALAGVHGMVTGKPPEQTILQSVQSSGKVASRGTKTVVRAAVRKPQASKKARIAKTAVKAAIVA